MGGQERDILAQRMSSAILRKMRKSAFLLMLLIVFTTFVCALIYLVVQQSIRQSANDPQVQIAQDKASDLSRGVQAAPGNSVDLATSLAPFFIIYGDNGLPIQSSGYINGKIPVLPSGVFDYVRRNSEDRITWQPAGSVRIAAVITRFDGVTKGFVVAGRSLREVEKREDQLIKEIIASWIAMVILGFVMVTLRGNLEKKR